MSYVVTNIERGIEMCFWSLIRTHCALVAGTVVRPWQNLDADAKWSDDRAKGDRVYPLIDVRCGPTVQDPDNFRAGIATTQIALATDADEDRAHADISAQYTAVIEKLNNLYGQYTTQALTGAEYVTWAADWAAYVPSTCEFGGFTWGSPSDPETIDGINSIGVAMSAHYSRSDY